jgi:hypothetical protein
MPEAAIHEQSNSCRAKDEIGLTEDGLMSPPARYAVPPQQLSQCDFRLLVAASKNARHHLRTLGFCKDI